MKTSREKMQRRAQRVRTKLRRVAEGRPRLSVSRSHKNISVQIIDDEKEVGGYPVLAPTAAPFVEAEWNLETMTPKSGRYPGQKAGAQEHLSPRDTQMRESAK